MRLLHFLGILVILTISHQVIQQHLQRIEKQNTLIILMLDVDRETRGEP